MRNSQYQGTQPKMSFVYHGSQGQGRSNQHIGQSGNKQPALFEPFNRVASLPPRKKIEEGTPIEKSHIKIVETIAEAAAESKKRKRAKIFDSPPQRSMSVIQPKPVQMQVAPQYVETIVRRPVQTPISTPSRLVNEYRTVVAPASPLQIQKVPESDREIQQRVYNRILDKLSQAQSPLHEQPDPSIVKKEQEIVLLNMEVDRLKRCEQLSHQNSSLYQKLVEKLKEVDRNYESSLRKSRKKMSVVQTSAKRGVRPASAVHSGANNLSEIPVEQSIIVNKKREGDSPSFMDRHREAYQSLHNSALIKDNIQKESKTLTFSRPAHKRSHPKRIKEDFNRTLDKKKCELYYHLEDREKVLQMPMTNRLGQINSQLQRNALKKKIQRMQRPPSANRTNGANFNWTQINPIHHYHRSINYGRYHARNSIYS